PPRGARVVSGGLERGAVGPEQLGVGRQQPHAVTAGQARAAWAEEPSQEGRGILDRVGGEVSLRPEPADLGNAVLDEVVARVEVLTEALVLRHAVAGAQPELEPT